MKRVLVTGASTGIGWEIAKTLGEKNFKVFAGARNQKDIEKLNQLENVESLLIDVTESDTIHKSFEKISADSDELFALINNAGIVVGGPLELIPIDRIRKQFDVNVIGLVETTQVFLPMIRKARGRIINMSSIAGRLASPFMGPYSGSKFAVEAFSDSLRREVQSLGVNISLIEPGPIKTPIWKKSFESNNFEAKIMESEAFAIYKDHLERFQKRIEKIVESARTTKPVIEAVLHALQSPRPKARYPIGSDIKIQALIGDLLPTRMLDKMIQKI